VQNSGFHPQLVDSRGLFAHLRPSALHSSSAIVQIPVDATCAPAQRHKYFAAPEIEVVLAQQRFSSLSSHSPASAEAATSRTRSSSRALSGAERA
jgi:hypothetical protein